MIQVPKNLYPQLLPCGCRARRTQGDRRQLDVYIDPNGVMICLHARRWTVAISVTEVGIKRPPKVSASYPSSREPGASPAPGSLITREGNHA